MTQRAQYICSVKNILIIALISISNLFTAQSVVDTVVIGNDSVVIFADKSWEYLDMINFDGIVNQELYDYIQSDSNYQWQENWDNETPYTLDNDLSLIPDTLWLCTVDSNHNEFCMPHPGLVTSTFKYRGKRFHYGIDVDLVTGDTLSSVFDGIVRYAKYNSGGFGNLVIIRHYNGLETYYAHLDKIFVSPNQQVNAGTHIGLGGKTGRAFGDHLHFEIRFFGNAIDPELIIDFKNNKLQDENLFLHSGMFDYKAISSNKNYKKKGKASSSESSKVKYHKIRSGDSLYAIALKYKTSVNSICALNSIKASKILRIGEVLKVRE